jgi:hypothetical protein
MPLPGSHREKKVLQEIVEPEVQLEEVQAEPSFLQEIKEPTHEEVLVEQPKRRRRSKKK